MHLVHCHHFYMTEIQISLFIIGSIEFGKYSTAIPSIGNCLFPPQCWLSIYIPVVLLNFLHNISLILYIYLMHDHRNNHFYSSCIPLDQEYWHDQDKMPIFLLWEWIFFMKDINNFLVKKKYFFTIIIPFFVFVNYAITQLPRIIIFKWS